MKRVWLVFALLVLAAGTCLAQFSLNGLDPFKLAKDAGTLIKGVAGISLKEENSIGGAVAIEIVARFGGVWKDVAATQRVNIIGKSLARYCARSERDFKFGLLDSDTVNAFSAPGGYVFITKGLYDLVGDNDDQLAGVLGHEITHVTQRHALKIIERGQALSGGFSAISDATQAKNDNFAQLSGVVGSVTKILFEKGFDPKTEYAADTGGRALAALTGYAPGGLRATLIRLKMGGTNQSTVIFPTHPSLDKRIKRLPEE